MSLKLILTRHAKSDWGDPMLADRDRPLNKRGRRDAPRIGAWLASEGHVPDQALISAARRTQETWSLLSAAFAEDVPATFLSELYHAGPQGILEAIQGGNGKTLILIAHNPGIAEVAHRILRNSPSHPRFYDYPTAATLVCRIPAERWDEADWGMGETLAFLTPHDL